jgi:hypothetical protein
MQLLTYGELLRRLDEFDPRPGALVQIVPGTTNDPEGIEYQKRQRAGENAIMLFREEQGCIIDVFVGYPARRR